MVSFASRLILVNQMQNDHKDFSYRSVGVFCLLLLGSIILKCKPEAQHSFQAPLFDNMGNYAWPITTTSQDANQFFSQAMILASGFNHAEAARSLREAVRLDSTCAMCYWGLAYVLGPNYNATDEGNENKEIRWAMEKALGQLAEVTPLERLLIEANDKKFGPLGVDEEAYEMGLRNGMEEFKNVPELLVLLAESIMNQHAWDLYEHKGGPAKPWTPEIVNLLKRALFLNEDHPLANHLFIHATEASKKPEEAIPSAEKLEGLVPGSGHLVHMPSHVYINTGDYHKGTLANQESVQVDSIYIAQCQVQGAYPQLYYPHNYHFLATCAALEGRGALALESSFKMTHIIEQSYLGKPGFETVDHYLTIPYNMLVKFAQWEKILALNELKNVHPYRKTIWRYARGMAYANTGNVSRAEEELLKIRDLRIENEDEEIIVWGINSTLDLTRIAKLVLEGEIAWKKGDFAVARALYEEAINLEDQLRYDEPPDWIFSVRHTLGELLMEIGLFSEAQKVYEEDLARFPKNGYSLNGLCHSYKSQGKNKLAEKCERAFEIAWQYADVKLKYSRVDPKHRENLSIPIGEDTPNALVYIASASCGF